MEPTNTTWAGRGSLRLGAAWLLAGLFLAGAGAAWALPLPADWRCEQQFSLSETGLVKVSLPVETLGAARFGLEDLRLLDSAGREVPFTLERVPAPVKVVQKAKSFRVAMQDSATVLVLETGLAQPLEGVTLESPAVGFIKPARVEASRDGEHWLVLAEGQPVFHFSSGASRLHLALPEPARAWPWLRLTIDDRRSEPVPWTGACLHAATALADVAAPVPAPITERHESAGETRLTLNLGAANLELASVQIQSADPLFTRQVKVLAPVVREEGIQEQLLGEGAVYRVGIDRQVPVENDQVRIEQAAPSRELVVQIRNQDSPPLSISSVQVWRRPLYLVFYASDAGAYHLLSGNRDCQAPSYDLSALRGRLSSARLSTAACSSLMANPAFHPAEALAEVEAEGTELDTSEWRYRKAVRLTNSGPMQLELDPETLAHMQADLADLRLMRGKRQLPYVVERTSLNRVLVPAVTLTNLPKEPHLSRWLLRLPNAGLPVARLSCQTRSSLFYRSLRLSENLTDSRGDAYRRELGEAAWQATPAKAAGELRLVLERPPQSATLMLETDNGDNPAIAIEKVQCFYPVTRLLFKAPVAGDLSLYYGNPRSEAPRYDLSLVAGQLLGASRHVATLDKEEVLKRTLLAERQFPLAAGVIFWGVLGLVVIVLLLVLMRLLPKP